MAVRWRWGGAAAGLALIVVVAGLGTPNAGTPKDGNAGPTVTLADILAKKYSAGTMVSTDWVTVTKVSCGDCWTSSTSANIYVKDSSGKELRTYWTKYPEFNAKKENWYPLVGWSIRVQGRVDVSSSGVPYLDGKRWGESKHPGEHVRATDTSKFANGKYVWLDNVKLSSKSGKPDGDMTYSARDASTGKGFLHLELSLPYNTAGLREPSNGEVVNPYGMLWKDYVFGYWEIHPVRCWKAGECAPSVASFVDNQP